MLRSSEHLQTEISLRSRIEELADATEDSEPWDEFASRSNRARLDAARLELAQIKRELEWEFEGSGVLGQTMQINRLIELTEPLGQALRWVGRDLLYMEGEPSSTVGPGTLVEPVIVGTFGGSFGLKIGAPPVGEQLSLEGSLFDRVVAKIVAILAAAKDEDPQARIAEQAHGLRENALSGLTRLTFALSRAGRPSRIRWRGGEVVIVTDDDATLVNETLSQVTPHEETITIQADIPGGDYVAGTFHLIEPGDPPRDYKGSVEEDVRGQLRSFRFGQRVNATLRVIETDSPYKARPKTSYVLIAIESVERSEPPTSS